MEDRERFIELIRALPLVSVDLVLVRDGREVGRIVGLRARKVIVGALDRALAGDVAITGA